MNPRLQQLQPYAFERLRRLLHDVVPAAQTPIRLSVGEPQHPSPSLVTNALRQHLDGLARYPLTAGTDHLREVLATWFARRYRLPAINPASQVLPVLGSREALFAIAQTVVGGKRPKGGHDPWVVSPNPFYQIYEGAAILAGASPVYLNQTRDNGFSLHLDSLSAADWNRVELLYVCSPGNPTGRVLTLDEWRELFDYADRYGFIIASDECYSEIYFDEGRPPLGGLEAAFALGRLAFERLVVFTSLSKRSSVPGLRSGAVAGDAEILEPFLRYRTYHGSAMSPAVQEASVAAWSDEAHVVENRALYRRKFEHVVPMLASALSAEHPDAGFYLWARVPDAWGDDEERFARELVAEKNVTVLPGRYLAREAHGVNPGVGRVRIALVATPEDCIEAAHRMVDFCNAHRDA